MPEMVQNPTTEASTRSTRSRSGCGWVWSSTSTPGSPRWCGTHERVVYSVALRLSDHADDAEDVAAETFLRAYRALRGYDAARIRALRIRPWLLTILRNTARNAARDAGRRPGPPPDFEPAEPAGAGPSVGAAGRSRS